VIVLRIKETETSMPEQFADRKRLFELFKKVTGETQRLSLGQTLKENMHNYDFWGDTTSDLGIEGRVVRTVFDLQPHRLDANPEADDVYISIKKDDSGNLIKFTIDTSERECREANTNSIVYDFQKDGDLTVDKAAELIDIFTLAIIQISPLDMDRAYGLMEGPDLDDAKARRTSIETRAMTIAETLAM